jgi:UrcA family protein
MPAYLRLTCLIALAPLALSASPARAEDGVWKVGTGYVIRFEKLDLTRAADRQILLGQVEQAAEKACQGFRPTARREACAVGAVQTMMKSAAPGLRASLDVARFERDGLMQASR